MLAAAHSGWRPFVILLLAALQFGWTSAVRYEIGSIGAVTLTDQETKIEDVKTLFPNKVFNVIVRNPEWVIVDDSNGASSANKTNNNTNSNELLVGTFDEFDDSNNNDDTSTRGIVSWRTFLDGIEVAAGETAVENVKTTLHVGDVVRTTRGRAHIHVILLLDGKEISAYTDLQTIPAGVSILPLMVIILLAVTTKMVELSLFTGVFLGAWMITGSLIDGFKATLDTYLVNALYNADHVKVILFSLFLSGVVCMMKKSGGMLGFTRDLSRVANTPQMAQVSCFLVGMLVFFDDYASILLGGETMRPLLDLLHVSREKLCYIVDGTAAPITSLSPISSWVGFEADLIQQEINKIIQMEAELQGVDNPVLGIKTTGLGAFLQSIKYRYYPINMLILMILVLATQRDFGFMLIAERRTQVYKRQDGGDGDGHMKAEAESDACEPLPDTPKKSWNFFVPVTCLIFFIFYLLVQSGEDPYAEDQTIMDKIESSNSYLALLWGTMATAICTSLFYWMQIVQEEKIVLPIRAIRDIYNDVMERRRRLMEQSVALLLTEDGTGDVVCLSESTTKSGDDDDKNDSGDDEGLAPYRSLMSVSESGGAFLYGLNDIFPAILVLTLAWASGTIMVEIGADRFFSAIITKGIDAKWMPTISYLVSLAMALATGTSWGTMTIILPLILIPTYKVSGGDPTIFYATVSGALGGSVTGDHISPISDTTVLSAMSCGCGIMEHVKTHAPYAVVCTLVSIVFGTIPIGMEVPNMLAYILGWFSLAGFVWLCCSPILHPTGKFDVFTEFYLQYQPSDSLEKLRGDTAKACAGEEVKYEATEHDEEDGNPSNSNNSNNEYSMVRTYEDVATTRSVDGSVAGSTGVGSRSHTPSLPSSPSQLPPNVGTSVIPSSSSRSPSQTGGPPLPVPKPLPPRELPLIKYFDTDGEDPSGHKLGLD